MIQGERTAGSMPVWDKTDTPAQEAGSKPFGFADILDMVNPLQHIPVISHFYRQLTGDEIRPAGKIIGGGIFGGLAGIASGLINLALEQETGKDLAGNAINFISTGEMPHLHARQNPQKDLPGNLLAFADLGYNPADNATDYLEPEKRPVWERG